MFSFSHSKAKYILAKQLSLVILFVLKIKAFCKRHFSPDFIFVCKSKIFWLKQLFPIFICVLKIEAFLSACFRFRFQKQDILSKIVLACFLFRSQNQNIFRLSLIKNILLSYLKNFRTEKRIWKLRELPKIRLYSTHMAPATTKWPWPSNFFRVMFFSWIKLNELNKLYDNCIL